VLEIEKQRTYGDYTSGTDDEIVSRIMGIQPVTPLPVPTPAPVSAETTTSIPLQDVISEYQNERIKAGVWKASTIKDYNPRFNAILQFFGNVPANTITRQQAVEFKKLLSNLPPGFGRMKAYKDLSGITAESIAGKHEQQLDLTTLRNYLQTTSAVFSFAVRNGYMEKNPAEGLQPPKKKQAREQRQPFDESDLQKLFHSKQYVKDKHAKSYQFWLPILGLYTGCRLKELCQLYVEDVIQIDGIWCLDINGNKDKELKNESSERVVPLHPVFVDVLDFPNFVMKVKASGKERVFGDLKKQNGDYGHYASKWFATYKGKAGIDTTPNKKVFHSFRHNFADTLFKNMVMETVIEELTGRAGKTETSRRYAKGYNIKELYEVVSGKLDYPVNMCHLKKSKWVKT
jgi:integrase